MKFRFSLERILHLRGLTERERARALAEAARAESARRDALSQANEQLSRFGEQAVGATGRVARAGLLRSLRLAVDAATSQLREAVTQHESAGDALRVEEERFGAARRDRRVLERYRERVEADWNQEASRKEQRDIDEAGRGNAPRGNAPQERDTR